MVSFQVIERQIGGPDLTTPIEAGEEGAVTQKIDFQPHAHMLYVKWDRKKRPLPVSDDQIANLARID